MQKPLHVLYQGRQRWTVPKIRMIEYLAWAAKGPVAHDMLKDGMAKEFDAQLSTNSVSNLTTLLVKEGRILRLNRGMFVHADHAGIFE